MSFSLHACVRSCAEQFPTDGFLMTDDETEKGNERNEQEAAF